MPDVFPQTSKLFNLTNDINCSAYNEIIKGENGIVGRLTAIQQQFNNKSELEIQKIRGYSRESPFTTRTNRISKINHAGSGFIQEFPSKCFQCSDISSNGCNKNKEIGLYDILLNKKGYMFTNSNNKNVISGPIKYRKGDQEKTLIQFGGISGAGLTQNKQLSNLGKGLTTDGNPGRRFAVQKYINGNSMLYSNSNIYNNVNPIINRGRPFIPLCVTKN